MDSSDEDLSQYLNLSLSHFLSIIKLNRLFENKIIDVNTYDALKKDLVQYFNIKDSIYELDYVSYISDNVDVNEFLFKYSENLSDLFKKLSSYDVLFDPTIEGFCNIFVNGIDKNIKYKRKRRLL